MLRGCLPELLPVPCLAYATAAAHKKIRGSCFDDLYAAFEPLRIITKLNVKTDEKSHGRGLSN